MKALRHAGLASATAAVLGILIAHLGLHAAIRGPVSGFVFDERTRSLRPVNGLPGAALLGEPVPLTLPIQSAVASRNGNFALAVGSGDQPQIFVIRALDGDAPQMISLGAVASSFEKLVMNELETVAALYSRDAGRILVITGIPDNPAISRVIDVSSLPGALTALAVSSDGAEVLVGMADETSGAIYLLRNSSSGQDTRLLHAMPSPSAVAFLHSGADVVASDRASNRIVLIRAIRDSAERLVLADAESGIQAPSGVQALNDGKAIVVVNSGNDTVTVINLEAGSVLSTISVPGHATRCDKIGSGSLMVLNEPGAAPLLLLEFDGGPKISFVPRD